MVGRARSIRKLAMASVAAIGMMLIASAQAQPRVEIEMWHWAANKEPVYQEIIAAYQAENPNVTITTNVVPRGSYWQVLTAAQIGRQAPAILHANPLGEVLEQWENDQIIDLTPYFDDEWQATFYDSSIDSLTIDGRVLSVSEASNNAQVLYNVDRFEELGIDVPFTTMDDLRAAVETLRANGYGGAMYWAQALDQASSIFINWARQKHPEAFDAADRGDGSWEDPDLVDLMRAFAGYADVWEPGITSMSLDLAVDRFASGDASIYIIGNWAINSIVAAQPAFEIGTFPVPGVDESVQPAALGSMAGTWMVSSQASDAEREVAIDFLRFLTMGYQGDFVEAIGLCPAGPAGEPSLAHAHPIAQSMCSYQDGAVARDMFDARARDAMSSTIQGMLMNQATPEDVMRNAQREKMRR